MGADEAQGLEAPNQFLSMNFTYLIPHAGSEELFALTKKSIEKYTPAPIITVGKEVKNWPEAWRRLWDSCPTDIGIFMDDDAILLKDITPLIEMVASGEYDAVGIEGLPPCPRNHKGYFDFNFMVIDITRFKRKHGEPYTDMVQAKEEIPQGLSIEPFYGVSQKLRGRIFSLPRESTGYGLATTHEYLIHLWYGAWRHRNAWNDGLSPEWFMEREKQFIKDHEIALGLR